MTTTCRTGVLRDRHPANFRGPVRRQPLIVAPEPGPYRAALTETADGVVVRVSRDDRPRGERLVHVVTLDAPMHVVADRLHDELAHLNRGERACQP